MNRSVSLENLHELLRGHSLCTRPITVHSFINIKKNEIDFLINWGLLLIGWLEQLKSQIFALNVMAISEETSCKTEVNKQLNWLVLTWFHPIVRPRSRDFDVNVHGTLNTHENLKVHLRKF